jgi:dihydrofolate reductase
MEVMDQPAGRAALLRLKIAMSLDGFVAGPNQSVDNPLGVGGMRLHQWVFPLAVWRAMHGLEGGETNESTPVMEQSLANIGATVIGRNMFGGHPGPWPGPWNEKKPWNGWWGANPPFHHPVFVLTHHARDPMVMEGGTTFTFVTEGIEEALEQARQAAGGKDVSLAGGASAAQQYLAAGLVDEMEIHLVPTLLGAGERLFRGAEDLGELKLVRTVAAPGVTHLKFARC